MYRELLRDPLVGGQVRRRKAAVARLQWRLDGDTVPQNVRDTVQAALERLDMYSLIKDMLNATLFGYQPMEIVWQTDSALWLPEKVIAKPQEWFDFNEDGAMYFTEYGAHGTNNLPLPGYKFLCPKQEAAYDNPYGLGDLGLDGLEIWDKVGHGGLCGVGGDGGRENGRLGSLKWGSTSSQRGSGVSGCLFLFRLPWLAM